MFLKSIDDVWICCYPRPGHHLLVRSIFLQVEEATEFVERAQSKFASSAYSLHFDISKLGWNLLRAHAAGHILHTGSQNVDDIDIVKRTCFRVAVDANAHGPTLKFRFRVIVIPPDVC